MKQKKLKVVGICLIGLLLIVLSVIGILYYKEHRKQQFENKYFDGKNIVSALDDDLSNQKKVNQELNNIMKEKKYTLDDPYVVIDPYGISPLTALVIFQTKKEMEIEVFINDIFVTTMEKSKNHSIPIYGLQAGKENKIVLKGDGNEKSLILDRGDVSVANLEVEVPNLNSRLDQELYFFSSPNSLSLSAFDGSGNALWRLNGKYALDIEWTKDGRMYLSNGNASSLTECFDGFYEMDYLGRISKNYSLQNGYHHELISLSNGNVIVAGGSSSSIYYADFVYEISPDGSVVRSISIYELFQEIDGNFVNQLKDKNILINSIYYDENSKEMILSLRGINSILSLNFETKQLHWILGDQSFFSSSFQPYLLQVTDNSRIPKGAHTAFLTEDGYLGLFNNDYDMVNVSSVYLNDYQDNYSSAVLYEIDGKNIKTHWEYDAGKKYFNYALGSFQYGSDHSKLINFGWTFKESAYVPETLVNSYDGVTYARVMELNEQDEIMFESTYPSGLYRVFKRKMYETTTKNYIDFDYEFISNNPVSQLEEIVLSDVEDLFQKSESSVYDFTLTKNTFSSNVIFDPSEVVDIYFVSASHVYLLHFKEKGELASSVINLSLEGSYAIYFQINGVMYNTNQVLEF